MVITHCFSLCPKGVRGENLLGRACFFERKIVDFSFKKHARPKETLFGRFLSEAKKGSSNYHEFL